MMDTWLTTSILHSRQWHALLASNCDQDTPGPVSLTPNSPPLLHGDRKRPKHPNPDHQVIKELTLILESTLHETLTHSSLRKQGQSRSAITEMQREAQRDEHHNTRNEYQKISPMLNITNEECTRVITPTIEIGTGEMNSTKQHSAADFVQNPTTTTGAKHTNECPIHSTVHQSCSTYIYSWRSPSGNTPKSVWAPLVENQNMSCLNEYMIMKNKLHSNKYTFCENLHASVLHIKMHFSA